MRHFETTSQFYRSKEWEYCKQQVIQRELEKSTDGVIRCGLCGEPIVKGFNPSERNNKGAIVFHHKIYLNNFNVNDASISINPDNIMVLHWSCHNEIHKRFGQGQVGNRVEKKVYLVTGASCSGKTTFVHDRMQEGDIVLDIDDIWEMVSGQARYIKPQSLKPIVFSIRDEIKGMIARGLGSWRNAFIIEGLPNAMERRKEADRYKAHNVEVVTMDTGEDECLARLNINPQGRDLKTYEGYIKEYFRRFTSDENL